MSKHTPGPWRIDPVVSTLVVGTKHPMPIVCDTEAASPFDVEVDEANARLIAAAPEMLEALKGALKRIHPIDPLNPQFDTEYMAVVSAIAKAERK